MSRKEKQEYFEKKEKLEKIRKKYLGLAKRFDTTIIDARKSPKAIIQAIVDNLD